MKINKGDKFICKNGKKGKIVTNPSNPNQLVGCIFIEPCGIYFWARNINYNSNGLTINRDLKEFDIEEIINWEVLNL